MTHEAVDREKRCERGGKERVGGRVGTKEGQWIDQETRRRRREKTEALWWSRRVGDGTLTKVYVWWP